MMLAGLAEARRYPLLPLPWSNQMNRSMLGTYCTIWSQQKPTSSFGKIVVGFNCVKVVPPSVEKAAVQFAVTKITPPPLAPLGSAGLSPVAMLEVRPNALFARNTMGTGALGARTCPKEAICTLVLSAVGVPGTNGAVGTGGAAGLTCSSKLGGTGGNGGPAEGW